MKKFNKFMPILAVLSFSISAFSADNLNFKTVVDLNDHKGTPFFEVMRTEIKPALDEYAEKGFLIADGDAVENALDNMSDKSARKALKKTTKNDVMKLADKLSKSRKKVSFYDLPELLSNTSGFKGDRYALTTFLSLASGGGVAVKMTNDIYAYNVNYGTGENDKDEMTGRSYGAAGLSHKASDASDADYLKDLEKVARPARKDNGKDMSAFTKALLETVLRSDTSSYGSMSKHAQAVMSDFVAVYTAEQDRHLMADLRTHHWDSALMEVTLLANFHAGQDKFTIMYQSTQNDIEFTTKVPDQNERGDNITGRRRQAGMLDYWQFSKNPANPNRSGINITRKAFSALEEAISDFMREKHPALVKKLESNLSGIQLSGNIFDEVSDFIINFKTQSDVKRVSKALVADYVKFLNQVRLEAKAITREIESEEKVEATVE